MRLYKKKASTFFILLKMQTKKYNKITGFK